MGDWKISRENVIKLITHYKRHKCLWDFRSNEYKRFDMKRNAWALLSRIFGKDVHTVKKKIKNLRSAYVSEKRRVVDSRINGSETYRPGLFYFDDLDFLSSIIVLRNGAKVYKFENDPIATGDEYIEEQDIGSVKKQYASMDETFSPPNSPQLMMTEEPESVQTPIKKQRKLAPYHSMLNSAVSSLAEISKTAAPDDTIYTSFGKTIALQLSQLPPLQATSTMSEIHQLLSNNIIQYMLSKRGHLGTKDTELVENIENGL